MLSTKEISEMLRVSEETVRRWIRTGELEATQDGKSYQIDQDWLEEFIQKKAGSPGTSLAKMQSLIEGLIGNQKTKDTAAEFFSRSINKFMQGAGAADFFNEGGPEEEDAEAKLESLNRKKKKLELEHQLKMIDLDEEIARYERIIKSRQGE